MLDELRQHVDSLARLVGTVDPSLLSSDDALALLELGSAVERLGSGLTALVAQRAVLARSQEGGFPSAGAWLASVTGTSVPDAIRTLETSGHLADLPATRQALSSGELSTAQARTICGAAVVDPGAEDGLLEAAGCLSLRGLQERAAAVKTAAFVDSPAQRAAIHRRRYLRMWSDGEGTVRLAGGFSEADGSLILSAVRSRAAFVVDDALRAGDDPEQQMAYDADALVALVTGDLRSETFAGQHGGKAPRADVMLHVNIESLRRGSLQTGECCEIPGVGPVSLAVARHLMGDAITRLAISDGIDVTTVCHLGRTVPSAVRSALEARDRSCVVPGCTVHCGLEIDHWQVPFAEDGPSELWNLARLCRRHHRMKTFDGFALGGGPGKWEWVPPD